MKLKMKMLAVAFLAPFAHSKKLAVGAAGVMASGLAMADSSDPTTTIVTQLGTYATDVGLIAAAVLLIVYGKKLVGYLRV